MVPDPGDSKACGSGSGSGSGSPTLNSRDGYNIPTDLGAPTASLRAGSGSTAWTAVLWVSLRTCNTCYRIFFNEKREILFVIVNWVVPFLHLFLKVIALQCKTELQCMVAVTYRFPVGR
jgi:hypothetical protein